MTGFDISRLIGGDKFHCVLSNGVVRKYTFITCAKFPNVGNIIAYRNNNGAVMLCTQETANSHFKMIDRLDYNNKRVCVEYSLWGDKIVDWISSKINNGSDVSAVLPFTLLTEAIGINRSDINKSYVLKLAKVLRGLGYESKLMRVEGITGRYWDLSPKSLDSES